MKSSMYRQVLDGQVKRCRYKRSEGIEEGVDKDNDVGDVGCGVERANILRRCWLATDFVGAGWSSLF